MSMLPNSRLQPAATSRLTFPDGFVLPAGAAAAEPPRR